MRKNALWSMGTAVRNPSRIKDILNSAKKIEGTVWDAEGQCRLQIQLIADRHYQPTLSESIPVHYQNMLGADKEIKFEDAKNIFELKNYKDPAMRGRTSYKILEKIGLAFIKEGKLTISEIGEMLIEGKINIDEAVRINFLKQQLPNPLDNGFSEYNSKPFINLLRLIKAVDKLNLEKGKKSNGISRDEFGIFALSLTNYNEVENVAKHLLQFRETLKSLPSREAKESYRQNFILEYLSSFENPIKNIKEYSDNMVRYCRMTKYITLSGEEWYHHLKLNPIKMEEIDNILSLDDGSIKNIKELIEWQDFLGSYDSYLYPWETKENLAIYIKELNEDFDIDSVDKNDLLGLRRIVSDLENEKAKNADLDNRDKVSTTDEVLTLSEAYLNIRNSSASAAFMLEKITPDFLNIFNISGIVHPNYSRDDEGNAKFTAPGGVADIDCHFDNFNYICEVTMLTHRSQYINEGEPVIRHLEQFSNKHSKDTYCLFIAPSLHEDTIRHFFINTKYGMGNGPLKVVPVTISDVIRILSSVGAGMLKGKTYSEDDLLLFYKNVTDVTNIDGDKEWRSHITHCLEDFIASLS